jgi:hypothetical protein
MVCDRWHETAWTYYREEGNRKPKETWKEFLRLIQMFSFLSRE